MATYGWSPERVRKMNGAQGWVYFSWAVKNEVGAFGPLYEQTGDGYIKQEANRIKWQTAKLQSQ